MSDTRELAMRLTAHAKWRWFYGMYACFPSHSPKEMHDGELLGDDEAEWPEEVKAGQSWLDLYSEPNIGWLFCAVWAEARDHKMMHIHQEQHTDGWRGWSVEVNGSDYYGESIGVALAKALLGQWGT